MNPQLARRALGIEQVLDKKEKVLELWLYTVWVNTLRVSGRYRNEGDS